MRKIGVLAVVLMMVLAPYGAGAHTDHQTDADDTDGPVDIAAASFQHSKKQFRFVVESYEAFDLQEMLANNELSVWIDMAPEDLETYYWLQASWEADTETTATLRGGPTYEESQVIAEGLRLDQLTDTKIRFKLPRKYLEGFEKGTIMGWAPWVSFPLLEPEPCYGGMGGCGDRAPDEGVFNHTLKN